MSFDDVKGPSYLIKQDNTIVIAIGVGNVNLAQINEISSDPDADFSFFVQNFAALKPIATNIFNQNRLCGVCCSSFVLSVVEFREHLNFT